ncbi:MAG: ABC transporter ATP-binding protein [Verrucomicrobiales bacterium]|nr:ABC transporter ATP-binding protein [Verrucomicrobiales bacterium]
MTDSAIHVENLHRTFDRIKAVDGITFAIPHGQVVGFVGANGAGKTTTMRILATLDYPTSGRAFVQGINVVLYPRKVRSLLGWVPDSFGTYENMTVLEYLDFFARALNYRGAERVRRIQDVVEFTDLSPLCDRMVNKLSKGQGQRLCLGRALIHDPQVLIMDEPAAGLDPKARVELKRLIRLLAEEGKTILISSHILSELGEMCDSLLFVDKGKIVHFGTAEALKRGAEEFTFFDVQLAGGPEKLLDWALVSPHVKIAEERKAGARILIDSTDPEIIAGVLRRMVQDGLPVLEFHREERNLEDAFIDMLGRIERGQGLP